MKHITPLGLRVLRHQWCWPITVLSLVVDVHRSISCSKYTIYIVSSPDTTIYVQDSYISIHKGSSVLHTLESSIFVV
jgi:hypothetical protein